MTAFPELLQAGAELTAWRHDLHAHPELAYEERRTAALVAQRLKDWGYTVEEGVAGTGVIGWLQCGRSSRAIGLRADMDALPVAEENRFAHASRHAGRMHACGHDGHTVMLLGAARQLATERRFDGRVVLIFQPAEERGAGAQRMVQAGLFERHPCEAVFALHNWPGLPFGHFGLRAGPMMAGTNGFCISLLGRSAHAAMPHLGVDALMVACHVALALQLLVARERDPLAPAVLTITQIHAGDTMNTLAQRAELRGTVRVFDEATLDRLEAGLRRMANATAAAHGAQAQIEFSRNYPPLHNPAAEVARASAVMRELVGDAAVHTDIAPSMAAEDFAYLLRERPGCYAFLGSGEGSHRLPGHGEGPCELHSGSYDFNDALLPLGASYFVLLARRLLARS
ncbi:MAG: amidohydrolase [Rubrivivax sp.]|nr:amidohydrolase [Rubrivivax sp.]